MGKVIQNKKGQTTITLPKALVNSLKLEKGMDYDLVVNHHSEIVVKFNKVMAKEVIKDVEEKIIPGYFG